MARRTRTYVAFDADTDMNYYKMMKMWKANDNLDFDFNNAHDLTTIREDSGEETIKRHLRERMANSKILVLLVGEATKTLKKYVPYEISIAEDAGLPIIIVNLNKKKSMDKDLCPTRLQDKLAIHIPFGMKIMQYAIDNWPTSHTNHKQKSDSGPYYYTDETYAKVGAD